MRDKKYIKVVAVLIKLTQNGSLRWRAESINREQRDISNIFTSVLKNIPLRLTKYWETDRISKLEIIDCNGSKIYEFPYTYALEDLFTCVCPGEVQAYRGKILDGIIECGEEKAIKSVPDKPTPPPVRHIREGTQQPKPSTKKGDLKC